MVKYQLLVKYQLFFLATYQLTVNPISTLYTHFGTQNKWILKLLNFLHTSINRETRLGKNIRELKQRRGQRLVKNEFIFYSRISRLFRCLQRIYRFKNWLKLNV